MIPKQLSLDDFEGYEHRSLLVSDRITDDRSYSINPCKQIWLYVNLLEHRLSYCVKHGDKVEGITESLYEAIEVYNKL